MVRKATAVWQGNLKAGKGTLTAPSGAFQNVPYNFGMRFADEPGTNPEELIGAAHAGCFSMALSGDLEKAGFLAERLETQAEVTLDFVDGKATVTRSHLRLRARVPGIDQAKFQEIANGAKSGCPISRLLRTEITLEATLES